MGMKLNFGCGSKSLDGFLGVDVVNGSKVTFNCKAWHITNFVEKNSVCEIYARHFLEHLNRVEVGKTLQAWHTIMEPGAKGLVIVPDILYHAKQLLLNDVVSEFKETITSWEHGLAGFYGWQKDEYDVHKMGYRFETLKEVLEKNGFSNVTEETSKLWELSVSFLK